MAEALRKCTNCQQMMPISVKKCRNCSVSFQKRKVDASDIEELAKRYENTPFHHLKKVLKHRADIIFAKDCDVVVLGFHHNEERGSLWSYSPPGSLGEAFLEEESGIYVTKLFKQFILSKRKASGMENATQPPQSSGMENAPQPPQSTGMENATQPPQSTGMENAAQPCQSTGIENAPQPRQSTRMENAPQPRRSTGIENAAQPRQYVMGKKGEDQCVLQHSNKICLITVAPSHKLFKDGKISSISFQAKNRRDRSENKVSGKGKRGAQKLEYNSLLCEVQLENGDKYYLRSCIPGKLVEINEELVENPSLLSNTPENGGYIAIVLPKLESLEKLNSHPLLTEDQYKEAMSSRESSTI